MSVSSLLEVPQNIALAIGLASSATGADYNYLVQTAYRESRFEAHAEARTSSAQGLFQFIEETWLRTVKNDGPKFGLGQYAERIFKTRTGRHYVPDLGERKKILALRKDPKIASLMAGAFARYNADRLAGEIGRKPTSGELYLAHFLGATNAIRMIQLTRSTPERAAALEFPKAAKANRSIFYAKKRPRSLREVYLSIVRTHNRYEKARKHIRTLAKNSGAIKGTAALKRHLRTQASPHTLKVVTAHKPARKKATSSAQGQWSTMVRSHAMPVNFRGAVPLRHNDHGSDPRLARNR